MTIGVTLGWFERGLVAHRGGLVAMAIALGCGSSSDEPAADSTGDSGAGATGTTAVAEDDATTAAPTTAAADDSTSAAPTGDTTTSDDGGSSGSDDGSSGGEARGIQTVFIILFENKDWSAIKDSPSAPYINGLLDEAAHAEAYHNVPDAALHPSEPNYVWLEAGDALGFTDDSEPGPGNCAVGEDHLTQQLQAAGISWKSYQEDMVAGSCPLSETGDYAPKHNPMIFFDDVSGTDCSDAQAADCLAHVVPYSELAADLADGTVARYNFLTPNQCNDMHSDCGTGDRIKQGDDWLAEQIPMIQASEAYQAGGVILITWDEGATGNEPIGMIVVSPLAKAGYSNTVEYTHSSTLRTMQTIFDVGPLLHDAANATDLGDLFTAFP